MADDTSTTPPTEGPPQLIVVLDALDAERVAAFWSAALRYRRADAAPPYEILVPPEGSHVPAMLVQAVPEARTTKNRMHLDLHVDDPAAEVERLVGLGATRLGEGSLGAIAWTRMADPEGNEFCVAKR